MYTTGELADSCGVSVRTVQYYDKRGILSPSELSEGGRRLYSDQALARMKSICYLRDTGISLSGIEKLLTDADSKDAVFALLEEQEQLLRDEMNERKEMLDKIEGIRRQLKTEEVYSLDSLGDLAAISENRGKLKRLYILMLLAGLPITALQWISVILWITSGIWWPFVVWAALAIPLGILISRYYFNRVEYVCPECHTRFKPAMKEAMWAKHTPKLRELTCPSCGQKSFCTEVFAKR